MKGGREGEEEKNIYVYIKKSNSNRFVLYKKFFFFFSRAGGGFYYYFLFFDIPLFPFGGEFVFRDTFTHVCVNINRSGLSFSEKFLSLYMNGDDP